jgi:hypothetical protein
MSLFRRLFRHLAARYRGARPSTDALTRGKHRTLDLVCVAFSYKHGAQGRCFAGIDVNSGQIIRPVSSLPDGTLYPEHYRLRDGSSPGLLDVLRIPISGPRPAPHQPENWVTDGRWQRLPAIDQSALSELLMNGVMREPGIFGTTDRRIAYDVFVSHSAKSSLSLIIPEKFEFISQTNVNGEPQARGRFVHHSVFYNLPITDPYWHESVVRLPAGTYSAETFAINRERILLTISLGEPAFFDNCYKLIAAIFEAPLL